MKWQVISNISLCIICCVLGIIDIINSYEYYHFAQFEKKYLKSFILVFIIAHPVVLLFYYSICTLYLMYISDADFEELTVEKEYHEMIYYRELIKNNKIYIPFLTVALTLLSYFKCFSFYSLKFLLENRHDSQTIFVNVISTTLHTSVLIHSLFQSFPQIILQCTNNLLNMEDKHDLNMRGILNFSTIISVLFLSLLPLLYYREQKMITIFNRDSVISSTVETRSSYKERMTMLEEKKEEIV